jgi:hypothetical protein
MRNSTTNTTIKSDNCGLVLVLVLLRDDDDDMECPSIGNIIIDCIRCVVMLLLLELTSSFNCFRQSVCSMYSIE